MSGSSKEYADAYAVKNIRPAISRELAIQVERSVLSADKSVAKTSSAAIDYALRDWLSIRHSEEGGGDVGVRMLPSGAITISQEDFEAIAKIARVMGCEVHAMGGPVNVLRWVASGARVLLRALIRVAGEEFDITELIDRGANRGSIHDQEDMLSELSQRSQSIGGQNLDGLKGSVFGSDC